MVRLLLSVVATMMRAALAAVGIMAMALLLARFLIAWGLEAWIDGTGP